MKEYNDQIRFSLKELSNKYKSSGKPIPFTEEGFAIIKDHLLDTLEDVKSIECVDSITSVEFNNGYIVKNVELLL